MHRISASFAVGENCPVSIELIVFRDTPTSSARADCDSPRSCRASFSPFRKISLSSMRSPQDLTDVGRHGQDA